MSQERNSNLRDPGMGRGEHKDYRARTTLGCRQLGLGPKGRVGSERPQLSRRGSRGWWGCQAGQASRGSPPLGSGTQGRVGFKGALRKGTEESTGSQEEREEQRTHTEGSLEREGGSTQPWLPPHLRKGGDLASLLAGSAPRFSSGPHSRVLPSPLPPLY